MNDSKPWYASRGVVGSGVSAIVTLLALIGIQIDPTLQEQVVTLVLTIAGIGSAVGLWGRVKADKTIGKN